MFSTGFTLLCVLLLFLLSVTLYTVFDSISSNIDEVLSIKPSAVFVSGDYNFFISNDPTQMVNFPNWIPNCDSHIPVLLN